MSNLRRKRRNANNTLRRVLRFRCAVGALSRQGGAVKAAPRGAKMAKSGEKLRLVLDIERFVDYNIVRLSPHVCDDTRWRAH